MFIPSKEVDTDAAALIRVTFLNLNLAVLAANSSNVSGTGSKAMTLPLFPII